MTAQPHHDLDHRLYTLGAALAFGLMAVLMFASIWDGSLLGLVAAALSAIVAVTALKQRAEHDDDPPTRLRGRRPFETLPMV